MVLWNQAQAKMSCKQRAAIHHIRVHEAARSREAIRIQKNLEFFSCVKMYQ